MTCLLEEKQDFYLFNEELLEAASLRLIAQDCILSFFFNESFFYGGKIPESLLNTNENIDMLLEYDIIKSVNKAYKMLEGHELTGTSLGDVTGDVRLVSRILKKLALSKIPQKFSGGMLLLYLRFVEGIDF